ncbi:hypothetical protein [Alteromonas sp. a30]|uniref:hypothetical protein n=1 Tax=Alteromonas sp. a30 TaxID=2730917 RepID=UPI00227E3088|nr:hypothetical protein [Alteromonas sp. a30]MCY7294665.1 hypothetical protein [Alteromonas sp. a30]
MKVTATVESINTGISQTNRESTEPEPRPNAFGIGSENKPEIELSAQARILQQVDQNQRELRERFDEQREAVREREREAAEREERNSLLNGRQTTDAQNDFLQDPRDDQQDVRSNAVSERAAGLYQTISGFRGDE